jgi:suppressor for copper-sensitivity B
MLRFFLILFFVLFAPSAHALSTGWQGDDDVKVRLISASEGAGDLAHIQAGLEVKLAPGWHSYNDKPGDAGLPPEFIWDGSENFIKAEILYPAAIAFEMGELISYGYKDHVIYPIKLTPQSAGAALQLKAGLTLLICNELCIPKNFDLALLIPKGPAIASQHAAAIESAIAKVPPPSSSATNEAPNNPPTLWLMLLFALLGGFILNFMPCVLPVLSLKILSVVGHGGGDIKTVRRSFLMTTLGILFSFAVLAIIVIALKQAGQNVGWGVQFQEPLFLVFLSVVLVTFAANMLGLFEIPMPRFIADRMDPHYHPKLAGDFATGALATLLATPCTAPFLGTAIGFALAANTATIGAIFFMIGLGLALPYIGIALWPKLATSLPKPGAWMIRLRAALGAALLATAIWFIGILFHQLPSETVTALILLMLALIIYLRTSPQWQIPSAVKAVMLIVLLALPFVITIKSQPLLAQHAAARGWQTFNEDRLATERQQNKIVFVDITADWCLTCHANKLFVINTPSIQKAFQDGGVVLLQGDWTRRDETITQFLRKYSREGIPFNVVYGPGAPNGLVLSEVLTADAVRKALAVAAGK